MDEITDLLSEKRLAKYKGIGKENAIACHLFNCELAESFYSWVMTGFSKMSILSAEIRII